MVRKNRSQLRNKSLPLSDSELADQIGEVLRNELGGSRRATKTIMRWTGVSDNTARSWLNGRASPNGLHLLQLAAHSEAVMLFALNVTGYDSLEIGLRLESIESGLKDALNLVRAMGEQGEFHRR